MSDRLVHTNDIISTSLAEKIVADARHELTSYGRVVRDEDSASLTAIASTVEEMASGTAAPKIFLSDQPTGWGKTTAIAAIVRAIVNDPTRSHVGIVIFVAELRQIEELIRRIGFRPEQYVVRTGKDNCDLNNLGVSGLCKTKGCKKTAHRRAQVMFTTQQKLKALMRHQRDFNSMPFFDYCGADLPDNIGPCKKTRSIRLWDEAYVPVDPITVSFPAIDQFASLLLVEGQTSASNALKSWIEQVRITAPAFDTIPDWPLSVALNDDEKFDDLLLKLGSGGEEQEIVADAMSALAGREVRVVREDYHKQKFSISYRQSIPYGIEPLIVFDAGGKKGAHYLLMERNRGNVSRLASVQKCFRNLTVRFVDMASGHAVYRNREDINKLAAVVAKAASEKPSDEEVLIVHRLGKKAPGTTFSARVREMVHSLGGNTAALHFIHYGQHTATNKFQNVKHVIAAGVHQAPLRSIIALLYGVSGKPMHAIFSKRDVELMRMSRIVGDLNQAIGRGATRAMIDGDVPEGCTVDVIASSRGPLGFTDPLGTLGEMFPSAKVSKWQPRVPSAKPNSFTTTIDAARELLGDQSETLVTTREWAAKSGYSPRTLQRLMNSGEIVPLMSAGGIEVEKCGGRWRLKRLG